MNDNDRFYKAMEFFDNVGIPREEIDLIGIRKWCEEKNGYEILRQASLLIDRK